MVDSTETADNVEKLLGGVQATRIRMDSGRGESETRKVDIFPRKKTDWAIDDHTRGEKRNQCTTIKNWKEPHHLSRKP
jgi:hypothetical protein